MGDLVKKGQPVCLIEAMKLMNDVESEFAGRVVDIMVENGQPVEYGEPLIKIEVIGVSEPSFNESGPSFCAPRMRNPIQI